MSPSLIVKKRGKRRYYYAAECQRVDGKPRIVWQKYLGPVEALIAHKETATPATPREAKVFEFGAVAALLSIGEQLGLLDLLNDLLPKRNQGPSVGHYLLLAALNRAIAPTSKVKIGEWYHRTVLQRLWGFPPAAFSSKRFWDHMDRIPPEALTLIEQQLVERVIDRYDIDVRALLYDTTNFFTYVHTLNDRNGIAQRGHSKARRHDLRQVGMALLVAADGQIPLLHRLYAGNRNDVAEFRDIIEELISRYRQLAGAEGQITLVFDKGNNAADLIEHLWGQQVHLVVGQPLSQHPELLEVPLDEFQELAPAELAGVRVHRARVDRYGRYWTALVVHSESFFTQQFASITATLANSVRRLGWLQQRLLLWQRGEGRGKQPTVASVTKNIDKILRPQHMRRLLHIELDEQGGYPILHYKTEPEALQQLVETRLGKTILITDQDDWSNEQIVTAMRGQSVIEEVFRQFNHTEHLRWQPARHWTDQKIQVHGFYCVLAWMLVALAHRKARSGGLRLSVDQLLSQLGNIYEVVNIYPSSTASRPRPSFCLSHLTPTQKKLHRLLGLNAYQPGG